LILVDSSVWIDYFRGVDSPQVELLDGMFGRARLAVGDLIVAEVQQGVRDDREFNLVRKTLDAFALIDIGGHDVAVKAAKNCRTLRAKGQTVRKRRERRSARGFAAVMDIAAKVVESRAKLSR
jgi:predicted nucleic acid-binding protein